MSVPTAPIAVSPGATASPSFHDRWRLASKQFVALGGRALLANILAFSSAWAITVPQYNTFGLWCALGTMLLLGYFTHKQLTAFWRRANLIGNYVIARILFLAALLVLFTERTATPSLITVETITISVVGLLILGEPLLRRLHGLAIPYAEHLPSIRTANNARFGASTVTVVNSTFILITLGMLLLNSVNPIVMASLAVLSLVVGVANGADSIHRVKMRRSLERRLHTVLTEYEPVFALHWDAPVGTVYQIAMWLPFLDRLGVPYIVIVRNQATFNTVSEISRAPVILRKSLGQMDDVVTPSMKAVFYVNTATKNCHLIRYSHLTHIQLNHGDSDKVPSHNPVFRMYDKNFVAGQAAIDRFAANGVSMPMEMFSIVGRPQVESVEITDKQIGQIKNPTVLYAPTWSGFYADSDYCSLPYGFEIITALVQRGCAVVFRPHPYARKSDRNAQECTRIINFLHEDRLTSGREHIFGPEAESTMSVVDCFNGVDVMISDVSSVVADFLYSEKPLAMIAVSVDADEFPVQFPIGEAAYVIATNNTGVSNLNEVLNSLLNDDPLFERRRNLKEYFLGDIPSAQYAQRFLDEAGKYLI